MKADKPLLELPDQVLRPRLQEVRGLREVAMVLGGSCSFSMRRNWTFAMRRNWAFTITMN